MREPPREAQQVLGRRAGESRRSSGSRRPPRRGRPAEPSHRSSRPACSGFTSWNSSTVNAENRDRTVSAASGCSSRSCSASPEHVLEVESARRAFAPLVPLVDASSSAPPDRRVVVAELGEVPSRRDHPVLGPFDLVRELASGKELVRRRQGVRERGDQWGLRGPAPRERLTGMRGPETRELRERRRVERASLDPRDAERSASAACSSPAALSVNVTARICDASNAPLRTWHAMRCVMVVVFPSRRRPRWRRAHGAQGRLPAGESFRPARTASRLRTSRTLAPDRQGAGGMFWFSRNRFSGSNRRFNRARRSYFASP